MKRTKALERIKQCGRDNDTSRAVIKMKSPGESRPQPETEK
jgi:hypothetical protein